MSIASPIDQRATHGYTVTRRGDGARVFRRAMRHSRWVRLVRLAIPASILGGLAFALVAASFNPLRMLTALPVDFGSLVVSGTKITMQAPRIAGFTHDGRPYELTAHAAAQDVTKPNTIELQGVHAKSEMPDQAVFELTADGGIYNSKTEMLTLRQNIILKSTSGYDVYLSEAVVDVHSSNVVSEKPVEVRMQQGIINANRMEVVDSGDTIHFGNGVTMTMPGHAGGGQAARGGQAMGGQAMHLSGKQGGP